MVNTRSTARCGLDAAGVTDRVHRSSGSRAAVPERYAASAGCGYLASVLA